MISTIRPWRAREHEQGQGKMTIQGEDVFFLYDTMGSPLDLTERMAEEVGMTIDIEGCKKAMEEAKQKSRADRANRTDLASVRIILEAE